MAKDNLPLLTVSGLNVEFNHNPVLEDISFELHSGETLAVIGPNGAGKTVLFKALLGLVPFTGQITWAPGINIGYVPQRLAIESDLPITTAEFFALKDPSPAAINHTLAHVGFAADDPILKKKLGTLSGGQLQRILIAWALINHPQVLLFDEPTAGVDISSEETIYSLLHRLSDQEDLTMLIISHEMQVVYRYATNVLCLNKEKVCYGPPLEALDKETLAKLFGKDTGLYHHQSHHT